MANNHTGNTQPEIDQEEHDHKNLSVKKVGLTGYKSDTDEYIRIGTDADGNLSSKSPDYDCLIAIDSGDSNINYIGKAEAGTATSVATWQIKEVDETTGTQVRYADGDTKFDNIWDNRESLSY